MESKTLIGNAVVEYETENGQKQKQEFRRHQQETQMRLAKLVQQKLYRAGPEVPGYDVAAAAYPAYETSGDYFDFIPLPNDRLGIAVGDVEGHGFGSALVMALIRAYVRSFATIGLEVDQILTQVNQMLMDDIGDRCLVTLMLLSLGIEDRTVSYAGAGHVPGYVLDASGRLEYRLQSDGPPLGLFPQTRFAPSSSFVLHPGEALVLLTDGIAESAPPNGQEWGEDGVLTYLRTHSELGAKDIVEGLYREARRIANHGVQEDDITSIVIKVA